MTNAENQRRYRQRVKAHILAMEEILAGHADRAAKQQIASQLSRNRKGAPRASDDLMELLRRLPSAGCAR